MSDKSTTQIRGIYKINNEVDGKCYIGKSEDLGQRIRNHLRMAKGHRHTNPHLKNAIEKYGTENFSLEILEILGDDDDINEREKYYIELFKSYLPEHGYNMTKGGDGGNSYVDCMSESEKKEHYKKHREIRTGENNSIFGKQLYNDGYQMKYLSEEEISEYVSKGWKKGATDQFKNKCSKRSSGENNPFFGKHHSKETLDKIHKTREERGNSGRGRITFHKNGQVVRIRPEQREEYEKDGWIKGNDPDVVQTMIASKRNNWSDPVWLKEHKQNHLNHYRIEDVDIYGRKALKNYLQHNGYPNIGDRAIDTILRGEVVEKYKELTNKIQLIEKEK